MDWAHGYASGWRIDRIDPATWESCGQLGGVEAVSIDRDGTDGTPLLESGEMTVTMAPTQEFEPGWHRVVMEATQGQSGESVAIATLWFEAADGTYDKGYREDKLEGRSALWQAAEKPVGDGAYAPRGADGAAWAANALRGCIDAPVEAVGGFELPDHVVFDLGASVLQAVWAVLRPNGWCIQLDGRGEVSILPMPDEPSIVLDRTGACPMMSAVGRSGAQRSYTREFVPGVHPLSLVSAAVPERGMDGLYRILTQKVTCDKGAVVEETVEEV
jgi:hypothetical protein